MIARWLRRAGLALSAVATTIGLIWFWNLRDPHLLLVRDYEPLLLCALLALGFITAACAARQFSRNTLQIVCVLLATLTLVDSLQFHRLQRRLLSSPSPAEIALNKRLIVGFDDYAVVRQLARSGIAGVFLSSRNVVGKSRAEIKAQVAALQRIRRDVGRPPLIVATDQEGGLVSRLSPPLPSMPALSSVLSATNPAQEAREYGREQGAALASLGVTVNFSPVVDLKPNAKPGTLDFNTRIEERAISDDPDMVLQIARPYIRGLQEAGVTAVLKHFPGLRRVAADTHHFAAHLPTPAATLENSDWRPFETLPAQTDAWIMLAHVVLDAVDADRPVSTSSKVIDSILRQRLGFDGTLVTDDLTMGATYNRGFCQSVRDAMDAQVDYLLIAYDYDKYYSVIACLTSGRSGT
ncbi:glycoside hydrolase family 3 N-terminal domain-containing protein [Salinisphaera aquimarina]|uniref:beta-N-acetylhexosaminidase n=1 Tax=Salinisphaera aquimarina TaxID=2094031 RepID=A0ABV7EPF8_9GAMM